MKTAQLIILPSLALIFVVYLYWLAVQNAPPKSVKKTPVTISPLEIIATTEPKTKEMILAGHFDRRASAPGKNTVMTASTGTGFSFGGISSIETAMYNKKPFVTKQDSFLPSDRIYIVMEFRDLEKGKHHLSASWVNPEGKTINTSEHTILLHAAEPSHRSYFWLELMKNGPFTEMITGREYKGNVYGRWEVHLHMNGHPAGRREFTIRDT